MKNNLKVGSLVMPRGKWHQKAYGLGIVLKIGPDAWTSCAARHPRGHLQILIYFFSLKGQTWEEWDYDYEKIC